MRSVIRTVDHAADPDGAVVIADLEPGDEVQIQPGYGYPSSGSVRTEVITVISGYSALTNKNTRLACDDGAGIQKTGNHFAKGGYALTREARETLASMDTPEHHKE